MGYRSRLGAVEKIYKRRCSGCTYEQVDMFCGKNKTPYYPKFHTKLFELGKYFDQPEYLTPFYDFDIEELAESEFSILSKEGLKQIIAEYHDNIAMMYEEAFESKENACEHISSKVRVWSKVSYAKYGMLPYNLDQIKSDGEIANSWLYEYAIFNLIYIYRTFDFDKNYLIYSAW